MYPAKLSLVYKSKTGILKRAGTEVVASESQSRRNSDKIHPLRDELK